MTRVPRPRRAILSLGVSAILALSCSDARDAGMMTGPSRPAHTTLSAEQQVDALINQFYAGGNRTVVTARWSNVKRQDMRNQSGRLQLAQLAEWVLRKAGEMQNVPAGETKEHAATRLILLMSAHVYGLSASEVPVIEPTTDATVEIVQPAETDTVQTPALLAGAVFPAGAVSEPTIVLVSKVDESLYPEKCSGPLDTERCQYPLFYKFLAFPDQHFRKPVQVAVCHVSHGDRAPLADHERFRLAHERPAPGEEVDGGTVEGNIEILPLVQTGSLTDCDAVHTHARAPSGGIGRAAALLAGAARQAIGFFAPRPLYARRIDRGGGGETEAFSHMVTIDPQSRPNVTPTGVSTSDATVIRGHDVTVNAWGLFNEGTAAAVRVASHVVIARDTALTQSATTLATLPEVTSVPPTRTTPMAPATVGIAQGTDLGTWFLGVKLVHQGVHAESDASDNYMSVRITVRDPQGYACPGPQASARAAIQAAVDEVPDGGTVAICDGTFVVDSPVVVSKAITIRSAGPMGATLKDTWTGGFAQFPPPVFYVTRLDSGTVRFANLGFSIRGQAIGIHGMYTRVEVDSSEFFGDSTSAAPIGTNRNAGSTGVLQVTNSTFSGHALGIFAVSDGLHIVRNSTFDHATGGSVVFSNSLGHGVVEDNQFANCGPAGCIRILNAGNVAVRRNSMDVRNKQMPSAGAVAISLNAPAPHHPIVVEDNVILSARSTSPDSTVPAGWRVATGVLIFDTTSTIHVVRRNTITSAYRAVQFSGRGDVRDNRIDGGYYAFQQFANVPVTFTRNDVVGAARSFTTNASASEYRCNWWGTTDGPAGPPPNSPPYAPWALQPVAGTSNPCDPNQSMAVVHACSNAPTGGNPWSVATVRQAYALVTAGGTVRACDEVHPVRSLDIQKSVTFEPVSGMPTFDAMDTNYVLNSHLGGVNLTVRGLRLRGARNHLIQKSGTGTLRLESSELHPFQAVPYNPSTAGYTEQWNSGIGVFGNAGTSIVEGNRFVGGDAGIHANTSNATSPVSLTVKNNVFTGQSNAGMFTGGTHAGYSLKVEGNTFEQCGRMACAKSYGNSAGSVEFLNNDFDIDISRRTVNALTVYMAPEALVKVTGNVVDATGTGGSGDRQDPLTYPTDGPAFQIGNTTAQVSRNTVRNTFAFANLWQSSMSGSDNVVSRVNYVIAGQGAPLPNALAFQRNDVTDYTHILSQTNFSSADIRCNWWGSNAPPANPGTATPAMYTPWATQPIANQPGVQCDPNASQWSARLNMPTARNAAAVAVLNDAMYVMGGNTDHGSGAGTVLGTLEVYTPHNNSWSAYPGQSMPGPRFHSNGAAALNGRIYVAGGRECSCTPGGLTNTLFEYDPGTLTWTQKANMPTVGAAGAMGAIGGKLYVLNGYDGGATAALYAYDPATNTWTQKASAPHPHAFGAFGVINGKLYVAGGETHSFFLDVYDPATDSWTVLAPLPKGWQHMASAVGNGKLFLVGGSVPTSTDPTMLTAEVLSFDVASNTFTYLSPLPSARHFSMAAVINNTLYVAGGLKLVGTGTRQVTNEVFALPIQ